MFVWLLHNTTCWGGYGGYVAAAESDLGCNFGSCVKAVFVGGVPWGHSHNAAPLPLQPVLLMPANTQVNKYI